MGYVEKPNATLKGYIMKLSIGSKVRFGYSPEAYRKRGWSEAKILRVFECGVWQTVMGVFLDGKFYTKETGQVWDFDLSDVDEVR